MDAIDTIYLWSGGSTLVGHHDGARSYAAMPGEEQCLPKCLPLVFRNKGATPWAITRAEKLQLSVFLPNDLSLDDWYAGVYALPTVWPDVSMLGATNLRKVAGYDFHLLRKKFFCWRLLGLIPGGTPFSQLNKGVRDAMSATTERDV